MERCVMFKDWEIQCIKMQIKKKKIPIGIRSKQLKSKSLQDFGRNKCWFNNLYEKIKELAKSNNFEKRMKLKNTLQIHNNQDNMILATK